MAIKRGGVSGGKKQSTPDYKSYGLDTDVQPWGTSSSVSSSSSGGWGSLDSDSSPWDSSGFSSSGSSSSWNTPSVSKPRGNRAFSFGQQTNNNEQFQDWSSQDNSESDDDFANSFSSPSWGSTRSKYGSVRHSGYGGGRGGNRRAKDVFRENVLIADQVKQTFSNVLGYSSSPLKGRGREGAAGILRREANEIKRIFSDVIDSFRLW